MVVGFMIIIGRVYSWVGGCLSVMWSREVGLRDV